MAESQSECKIINNFNDFKMDVIRMVCHIYYSLEHCFLIYYHHIRRTHSQGQARCLHLLKISC